MRSLCLIVAVIGSYFFLRGFPTDWSPVLRIFLSGVIFVLGIVIWGRGSIFQSQSAQSERLPGWLDYLSLGVAILALESAFLFFFATAPERLDEWAASFDAQIHPSSQKSGAEETQGGASEDVQASGNWLWGNNGQRTLGTKGRVRPSNRPEVFLWPAEGREFGASQDDLYLRTFTLARYGRGTWTAQPIPTIGMEAERNLISLKEVREEDLRYEITHEPNASGQSLLVGIPEVTSVSLPSVRLIAPDTYRLPALKDGEELHRYFSSARPVFFDPRGDQPAVAELRELAVPEELSEELKLLTATLSGPKPEQLAGVRQLLAERCQYSLETNFDSEEEIVRQFLFSERRGYCEHFATAAALLARTIGYPARIAYGWSGGRFYQGPNMYVFRAKEAHAWAEVKVAGKGWVVFETTPANRAEGNTSFADASETPPSLPGLPDFPEMNLEGGTSEVLYFGVKPLPLLRLIAGSAVIVGGIALVVLQILKREKKQVDGMPRSHLLPTSASYLVAFRNASAALGEPMPVGRTLRAHLSTLESAVFAEDLLKYHYGLYYEGNPRDKYRERRLLKEIKHWRAQNSSS